MPKNGQLDAMIAKVDAEIEEKQKYRQWLLDAAGPVGTELKKRGRGKGKKGLPAQETSDL